MKRVTAVLLAFMLVFAPFTSTFTQASTFIDVREDYAFPAIERWAGYGVIQGRGDRVFDPYNNTTRAEFATMISNVMGYVNEAPVETFTDIPNNRGMNASVLRAANAGVFEAGGAFRPNDFITRAEAAHALVSALGIKFQGIDAGATHFIDDHRLNPGNRGAIRAAYEYGIIKGIPVDREGQERVFRFAPDEHISRKHIALLFNNIIAARVHDSTPLSGNIDGYVVVIYPNAVIGNAVIGGNIIISESAAGGTITVNNPPQLKNLWVQADDLTLVIGSNVNVSVTGNVSHVKIMGDNVTFTLNSDSSVNDMTIFGENVTAVNNGHIEVIRLQETAAESFTWQSEIPDTIVIFIDDPAEYEEADAQSFAAEESITDDELEEQEEDAQNIEEQEPTAPARPQIPLLPPSPPTGIIEGTPPPTPTEPPPPPPPPQPPQPTPVWRACDNFNYAVEVLGGAIAFVVVEMDLDVTTSYQWITGQTPALNQYRILVNGVPTAFNRVNLLGGAQYRLAIDMVKLGTTTSPTITVERFQ